MRAPESYNEVSRRKSVEQYSYLPQWQDSDKFRHIVQEAARTFEMRGCTISLIDQAKQLVKYSHGWDTKECPRKLSIDGHAILSLGYFVLLDASKDWRTENNPFVKGVPGIRFYAAVPLVLKNNNVIGAFAVFDHLARVSFTEEKIRALQLMARDVMEILNTPITKEQLTRAHDARMGQSVAHRIGRATARGDFFTTPIFEKDGSGGPYNQNHNFRLGKCADAVSYADQDVWRAVYNAHDVKAASATLCKLLIAKKSLDLVYIMEIRIVEPFQILGEYFPPENKIDAENYRYATKLVRTGTEDVTTRILGIVGPHSTLAKTEMALHCKAFSSEFGCLYRSKARDVRYHSGIEMPFYRHAAKLVREKRILKGQPQPTEKMVLVYHKSGGYLIGAFSEHDAHFSEETINMMFTSASMLRTIYFSSLD
ncbi:hypothetical protein BABINDRAFT_159403 [Babjeviella inositovora NRRL Y-12698]|uniref:GAF domain-containing protein n=1 Tax=Babjeviella inositovora NRRL Y-12698 TaxID=984486 RepID=A0A1E3QZD1_9ASCO|nr:uncharacterized protein BABINDRAFT_159403 [Babjeviella inositovora NRRL Y-12698]ODQ82914.1 hypothetical protein BABINDRAFT_159403 [Babjeviella inositovora NRRL Y-12698]